MMKYLVVFCIVLFTFSAMAQSPNQIDELVNNIYNLDFSAIPNQISELEKTDPQIAGYLRFDYLWWKMVSNNSDSAESEFIAYKNSFLTYTTESSKDFKTLIYYLYQIRYENYKKTSFSKYLTALKCHAYLLKIDEHNADRLSLLEKNIFQLIVEFDKCLKYRYISELDLITDKYKHQFEISLEKIENLSNSQYSSFETIKNYFLGKIYLEIENDSVKALHKFSELSERFPNNKIFESIKKDCKSKKSSGALVLKIN